MKREVRLRYNLQFFQEDKTEEPTSKKISDTRKKGQVAKSHELTNAISLIAIFLTLRFVVGYLGESFINVYSWVYERILPDFIAGQRSGLTVPAVHGLFQSLYLRYLWICLPFFLVGFLVTLFATGTQFKFKVTTEPLKPKLSKFNPVNGFKRIFSKQSLFNLVLSIIKITLIFAVAYASIQGHLEELFLLYEMELAPAIALVGNLIIDTGLRISLVYLIVGLADLFYQRWKFKNDIKMTKQEVKDEYKNSEGDPQIKGRQKQKMREVSMRRMMKSVPDADVVITNPTHIAVAIKYDANVANAPIVVAKGEDYIAQRIKKAAEENGVQIVENKPLARALYTTVDIGAQIPPELYQAVAEVLAMIYNSRNNVA